MNVKKIFDFLRDLQETNGGADRITYHKLSNELKGMVLVPEEKWQRIQKLIGSLRIRKENLKLYNPLELIYAKICGEIEVLEELNRLVLE